MQAVEICSNSQIKVSLSSVKLDLRYNFFLRCCSSAEVHQLQTFPVLNLTSALCCRFIHAAESLHVRVQRPERLQAEAGVHETAGQTLRPVHRKHGGWHRGQHTLCEGAAAFNTFKVVVASDNTHLCKNEMKNRLDASSKVPPLWYMCVFYC